MRVGFIGLGNIGKPMGERLARCSSHEMMVFDVRPEQTAGAVKYGARAANSLRELAAQSDIVEIVVRTPEQLRQVVHGEEGVLSALSAGSVIAVHSTVGRGCVIELAQACADAGVSVLDAPVSGGETGAEAGKLAMMVGGDAALLERCRPVFEVLAASIFHLGDVGAGQVGKIANNLLFDINMVGAFECMRLAMAGGIPETTAAAFIASSTGSNFTIQNWEVWARRIRSDGPAVISNLHKDTALALEMARELDVETVLGALARERTAWAVTGRSDAVPAAAAT